MNIRRILIIMIVLPLLMFRAETVMAYAAPKLHPDFLASLHQVNRTVNRIPYKSDLANWGRAEYWSAPEEMIGRNAGDCEDYALAKAYILRMNQVPPENLAFLVGLQAVTGTVHMVLVYSPDGQVNGDSLILDNLHNSIETLAERRDIVPMFAISSTSVLTFSGTAAKVSMGAGSARNLPYWPAIRAALNINDAGIAQSPATIPAVSRYMASHGLNFG